MFENFNFAFASNKLFLVIVGGIFVIIAVNFEFIIGWISAVDGNTTISVNIHTASILILFTWVGGIQLYLIRRNKSKRDGKSVSTGS